MSHSHRAATLPVPGFACVPIDLSGWHLRAAAPQVVYISPLCDVRAGTNPAKAGFVEVLHLQDQADMIVLTGTSGNLGSRVLTSLLQDKLLPPSEIIISSSNPDKVPQIAKQHNVEMRTGDFSKPASLQATFAGADALFLVSYPSPSVERWLYHKNAIDAAQDAGVKTIIYASLMFGGETGMESVAGALNF